MRNIWDTDKLDKVSWMSSWLDKVAIEDNSGLNLLLQGLYRNSRFSGQWIRFSRSFLLVWAAWTRNKYGRPDNQNNGGDLAHQLIPKNGISKYYQGWNMPFYSMSREHFIYYIFQINQMLLKQVSRATLKKYITFSKISLVALPCWRWTIRNSKKQWRGIVRTFLLTATESLKVSTSTFGALFKAVAKCKVPDTDKSSDVSLQLDGQKICNCDN